MTRKASEASSQTVLWLEGFKAGQVALMREVVGNLDRDDPTGWMGKCLFCGHQVLDGFDGPRFLPSEPHHPSCVWLKAQ